nr:DUF3558 family protein [Kibdelosporangium phytohabitans]
MAVSLGACKSETGGLPTPGNTTTDTSRPKLPNGGSSTSKTPGSTSSAPGDNLLKDLDPCSLLGAAETSTFAVGAGKPEEAEPGKRTSCLWNSTQTGEYSIQVALYETAGLKDVYATGGIKEIPNVGKRKAVQSIYGTSCAISLAVTETSRVDAAVASGNDSSRACQIATQVAQIVEPKLPGGS